MVATKDEIENVCQLLHKCSSQYKHSFLACININFHTAPPGTHHAIQCFFRSTEGLWPPTTFGVDAELVEVVTEFPQRDDRPMHGRIHGRNEKTKPIMRAGAQTNNSRISAAILILNLLCPSPIASGIECNGPPMEEPAAV
jgi:hypothetical protein